MPFFAALSALEKRCRSLARRDFMRRAFLATFFFYSAPSCGVLRGVLPCCRAPLSRLAPRGEQRHSRTFPHIRTPRPAEHRPRLRVPFCFLFSLFRLCVHYAELLSRCCFCAQARAGQDLLKGNAAFPYFLPGCFLFASSCVLRAFSCLSVAPRTRSRSLCLCGFLPFPAPFSCRSLPVLFRPFGSVSPFCVLILKAVFYEMLFIYPFVPNFDEFE